MTKVDVIKLISKLATIANSKDLKSYNEIEIEATENELTFKWEDGSFVSIYKSGYISATNNF